MSLATLLLNNMVVFLLYFFTLYIGYCWGFYEDYKNKRRLPRYDIIIFTPFHWGAYIFLLQNYEAAFRHKFVICAFPYLTVVTL